MRKKMLAATVTAGVLVLCSSTGAAQEPGNAGPPSGAAVPTSAAAAPPSAAPLPPSPPRAPITPPAAAATNLVVTPASTASQQQTWKRNYAAGKAILWTGLASILVGTIPLLAALPAKGSTQQYLLDMGDGVTLGGLALTVLGWVIAGEAGNHLNASAAPHSSTQSCRLPWLPCVSLRPIVAQSGARISIQTTF